MRILLYLTLMTLMINAPIASEAQRRYNVYKTDRFGNKSVFAKPEAIIEENSLTGDWEVYEPSSSGFPDISRGPSYIIERDSLSGALDNDHDDDHHHHDDDSFRHQHHHHNDDEGCDEEYGE
jgi:ABC-type nickel/cobalt efflux system permease component RcnA